MAYPPVGEVRLLTGLLHEGVDATTLTEEEIEATTHMVERLIVALDRERAKQTRFAIIEQVSGEDGVTFHVTGPFSTRNRAEVALRSSKFIQINLDGSLAHCRWAYMRHPLAYELALERADAPPRDRSVPHGHPAPYLVDDDKSREKYGQMTDAQKVKAFKERGGKVQEKRGRGRK